MYKVRKEHYQGLYILFLLGCIITFIFIGVFYERSTVTSKERATHYVELYSEKVQDIVRRYVDQTKLIESFIIASNYQISETSFQEIVSNLSIDTELIQAVQYLPDGIVSYVYPIKGNEASIGDDVLHVIDRRKDAIYAKEHNKIIVSAPVEIRQGGKGIIIRNPVYNNKQEFLGFVAIIMKLPAFLNKTDLSIFKQQGYEYCLSADDFGYTKIITQHTQKDTLKDEIKKEILIGDSVWNLTISPKTGWIRNNLVLLYLCIGLCISYSVSLVIVNFYQKKEMLEMLEDDDKVLRLALTLGKLEVFHYDFQTKVLTFNFNGRAIQDLSKKVYNVPESLANTIVFPQSRQVFFRMYQDIANGKDKVTTEIKVYREDKAYAWERITLVNLSKQKEKLDNIIGVIDDITDEKDAEEHLMKEKKMKDVMKGNCEIYIEANITKDQLLVVNDDVSPFTYLQENTYQQFLTTYIQENIYEEDKDIVYHFLSKEALISAYEKQKQDMFTLEYRCLDLGMYRWQLANVYLTKIKDNIHVMIVAHDNQSNKEKEMILRQQAETDALTGLYNRATLEHSMQQYLSNPSSMYAMFILDLDHFKDINDTMGHVQGDTVLQDVAYILRQNFSTEDDIGRLGGDEFVILKKTIQSIEEIESLAKNLNKQLRLSYEKNGITKHISASIGICIGKQHAQFQQIYSKADQALYDVKEHGKDSFKIINMEKE